MLHHAAQRVSLIAAAMIMLMATQTVVSAAIENDNCAEAVGVGEGETDFDTSAATTDGPAHDGCEFDGQTYYDIWYDYIASASGELTISTCNTASYDTDMVVYDGCACPVDDSRMLRCNDDWEGCEGFTSMMAIQVEEGRCYKIRVGAYDEETEPGAGTLLLDLDAPFAVCEEATGSCFALGGDIGCADGSCCNLVCDEDEFCCVFEWDQTCVDLAWSVCDPPADQGACCADGVCVGVTTQAACPGSWFVGQPCDAVDCYALVVDFCPGEPLAPGEIVLGDTSALTRDLGLPTCDTSVDSPGAWYYVSGNDHQLVATTCLEQTNYDTKINVFCATCTDPICVGGNDDGSPSGLPQDPACVIPETGSADNRASTVRWCSAVGAEYYVLVQGYGGSVGAYALQLVDEGPCDDPLLACVPSVGACCDGITCIGNTAEEACSGDWYEGMDCADFVCPFGACCQQLDCVGTTSESQCDGTWYADEECATFDCPMPEYCTPCWVETGVPDDIITEVVFADLSHASGEEGPPCQYGAYLDMVANVTSGQAYTLSVTVDVCHSGTCYVQYVTAWFDWDTDGDFSVSETYELGAVDEANPTAVAEIVVPEDAYAGPVRMRVTERYDEPATPCLVSSYGSTEDYVVVVAAGGIELTDSVPAPDGSLWRSGGNVVTLTFSDEIATPPPGAIMIQELLADGAYGPDLSDHFSVVTSGATLTMIEDEPVLQHGRWFAVRHVGGWDGVSDFVLDYVCQVGDATRDGRVLPNDLSAIQTDIPNVDAPRDSRYDIDGDGRVMHADLALCNAHMPSFDVPKPAGHGPE